MPRFRDRGGSGGTQYQMREKMFAIGDDFWVETNGGERAFRVNGKALRVRDTLVLESPAGEELYTIQEKKVRVRDTMDVEQGGKTVATIKKALVSPLRERYSIAVESDSDLEAKGNIVDHEYTIERDGEKVAEVSKRWFRVRDTYGIEVAAGQNDALLVTVASASIRWAGATNRYSRSRRGRGLPQVALVKLRISREERKRSSAARSLPRSR